jgi:hypothetical protein
LRLCHHLVGAPSIARVANHSPDPLRFPIDFRDEIRAVVKAINIAGMDNTDRVWLFAANRRRAVFADAAAQRRLIGISAESEKPRFIGISWLPFRTLQI